MVNAIDFKGKTIVNIQVRENKEIYFLFSEGYEILMCHVQDCCEEVWLEDIDGNLNNLINSPILLAEEVIEENGGTWTFYKFATAKGYVTLRWCGISNGYYSEKVSLLEKINGDWAERWY